MRYIGLGAADLLQQVVRLIGDQERVGENEQKSAAESPREVWVLPRVDVKGACELAQRPCRPACRVELAILQGDGEEQDEESADSARGQKHGELIAGEQFD